MTMDQDASYGVVVEAPNYDVPSDGAILMHHASAVVLRRTLNRQWV